MNGVAHKALKRIQTALRHIGVDLGRYDRTDGESDPFVAQRSLMNGNESPLIFDVGANIGQTALAYLSTFRSPRIHCFEPATAVQPALDEIRARNPNVTVHRLAVSDGEGKANLHLLGGETSGWNSLLEGNPDSFAPKSIGTIVVDTTTIDVFCREREIREIDILKLDIQGAELKALRGAETMLAEGRVGIIYAEADFSNLYENQSMYHDLASFLYPLGYRTFGLYNLYYPEVNGYALEHADVIFYRGRRVAAAP